MRYAEGHKEAVRANLLELAARALRQGGLNGISIPALMKAAGLTHGGFYGHFQSRDELVASAVLLAAQQTASRLLSPEAGNLQSLLDGYLSEAHAEHPEAGCVVAALGTEAPHQSAPVRRAFAEAARSLVRFVDRQLRPRRRGAELSDAGLRLAAQMVGAVVLARLVDDRDLARRLLSAAKKIPD
jgi:TetR/AcrR family transcriptional regulator, transcriptional repressor for nem operon